MSLHTRNITKVFRTATPAEIETGTGWYSDAYDVALAMAKAYDSNLSTAAGIIAALSPLNSWGNNVNLAHRLMASGGLTRGYLSNGLNKANAILAGASPMDVLKGDKVRNFYLSIISQGREGVCIDRHAYCIAMGKRTDVPSLSTKRYEAVADKYRRAARILSKEYGEDFTPAQVQSVTWTLWRRRYWAEGAWDLGH